MYIKTSINSEPIEVDSIYLSTTKMENGSDTMYSLIETPEGEIKLIKYGKSRLSIQPQSNNSIEIN